MHLAVLQSEYINQDRVMFSYDCYYRVILCHPDTHSKLIHFIHSIQVLYEEDWCSHLHDDAFWILSL